MAKTYALGLITAVAASASLSKNNCAYADGPFSFSPFSTSSNASQPSSSSVQSVQSNPPSSSSTGDAAEPPPKVRNDHPRTTSAGFDPEPLERGVQALEKISQSNSAKQVLEAIKKQEETRQVELNAKAAEYNALKAQFETERQRVIYDEQKKLAQHQAQTKSQMARYEDELARKRMQACSLQLFGI